MDQHYQWTDWSHQLPRIGYGGLIYNQNFAAEYHALLVPIALCLVFVIKSKIQKGIFLEVWCLYSCLHFLFHLPVVHVLTDCRLFLTGFIFISMVFLRKKDLKKENKKSTL